MYVIKKDYSGNGLLIKKGKYTKEELIKLYNDEERLNFCLNCTDLKNYIEPTDQEPTDQEPTDQEPTDQEPTSIFVAKENIKKGRKIAIKKDQKVTYEELESIFGEDLSDVFEKLIETKISK